MKTIVESIFEKNFDAANQIAEEKIAEIFEQKLVEMKKMMMAKEQRQAWTEMPGRSEARREKLYRDLTEKDLSISFQMVNVNNNSFKFTAFNDSDLREIQLQDTYSKLEQAIGRARLVQNTAEVYLFSNFCMLSQEQDTYIKNNNNTKFNLSKSDLF